MKKAKIAFWVILVCFLALVFFSNKDYFLAKHYTGQCGKREYHGLFLY